jgi:hypothetical protein
MMSMALVLLASTATAVGAAPSNPNCSFYDARNLYCGDVMLASGYLDQPYCAVNAATREWACVVCQTLNHEGGAGERVVSIVSADGGATWSAPVPLEPPGVALTNSYAAILLAPALGPAGRLYALYNMNLDNVTALPPGVPAGTPKFARSDELGHFVSRHSDDGGRSWSAQRQVIDYRLTAIDHNNTFRGATREMWNVDQIKVDEKSSTAYLAFTKIGSYPQNAPQEIWFLGSANALTEPNASAVAWRLLPDGDRGIAPPGGNPSIMEEGHIMPLVGAQNPGFYALARTTQGVLATSRTAAPDAAAGWDMEASVAQYWDSGAVAGFAAFQGKNVTLGLKNPRGPVTMKRFAGGLLLLFYNNYKKTFSDYSRNPYWLAAGEERNGTVLWSQPEVGLYDRDDPADRPGYADLVEDVAPPACNISSGSSSSSSRRCGGGGAGEGNGSNIFITETQKTTARVHQIDAGLLRGLWAQSSASEPAPGVAMTLSAADAGGTVADPPVLAAFGELTAARQGFALELRLQGHAAARVGQVLLDSRAVGASAGLVLHVAAHNGAGAVELLLTDGAGRNASLTTDPLCAARLRAGGAHSLAFVADAGPRILTALVDGVLCDGAGLQEQGWAWMGELGAPNAAPGTPLRVAGSYGGEFLGARIWTRALTTSECVSTHRSHLPTQ